MKLALFQLLKAYRSSYWFVPTLMVFAAIVIGAAVVWIDAGPGATILDGIGWYQKSKPDGARAVLSTIAGSMITVAGVVFSITIVAISFASSQYGPRVLTNFMSDRGNQITLGTFIATFAYCVAVLRTIYGGDTAFVPQLAIMGALVLSVCSIAVLIYFIHHVPESIHVNNVIARIGQQLLVSIDDRFPERLGDPVAPQDAAHRRQGQSIVRRFDRGAGKPVVASDTGYVEALDEGGLLGAACKHDLVIQLECVPGDFVHVGKTVARVMPEDRVDNSVAEAIRTSFGIGSQRTPEQDQLFLIDELVEIAARALSPGINDPYTAMTCIDWLEAAVAVLAERKEPSPYRAAGGSVRVIVRPATFREYVGRGFGRLRPYVSTDVNAAIHMIDALRRLGDNCAREDQWEVMREQLDAFAAAAGLALEGPAAAAVREKLKATSTRGPRPKRRAKQA